jgi:hypothetical protein
VNYKKIYSDFIASRQLMGCDESQYFETHHILPRSLGGTDEPPNLIKLSAGDHYFAHLCLAKIYGGNQWAAVLCMARMTFSKQRKQAAKIYSARRMVMVARRKHGEYQSASKRGKTYRHVMQKHVIYNIDGRTAIGALIELHEKFGISLASLSRLAAKTQGKTHDGWYMFQDELAKAWESKLKNARDCAANISGHNKRQVQCKETGEIFESITAASKKYGCHIGNAFGKNRSTAAGLHWEYV